MAALGVSDPLSETAPPGVGPNLTHRKSGSCLAYPHAVNGGPTRLGRLLLYAWFIVQTREARDASPSR